MKKLLQSCLWVHALKTLSPTPGAPLPAEISGDKHQSNAIHREEYILLVFINPDRAGWVGHSVEQIHAQLFDGMFLKGSEHNKCSFLLFMLYSI